jgi:6-pyruvoyltetrahydropterin/6-carboxytetrahydropterin synthase
MNLIENPNTMSTNSDQNLNENVSISDEAKLAQDLFNKTLQWRTKKTFTLDAAHVLSNMPKGHPCANQHGHTYKITFEFIHNDLDEKLLTIDFARIKAVIGPRIAEMDHHHLNEVFNTTQTTSEFIAYRLYVEFKPKFSSLYSVSVKETESSEVIFSLEEKLQQKKCCSEKVAPKKDNTTSYPDPIPKSASISEFERTKPVQTLQQINYIIDALNHQLQNVLREDKDPTLPWVLRWQLDAMAVLKKLFLKGE